MFLNQVKQPSLRHQGFLKPVFAIQTRSHHRVETAPLPWPLPRAPTGPGPAPPPHCGLPWSQRPVGRVGRRAPPQAGRAKGKILTAGQGRPSREESQLGGGRVGIWTKPHCRLNMMPLTYFPVGKPREDAHGATWLRGGTPAWCPHVPSAGFRHPPRSLRSVREHIQSPLELFKHRSAPASPVNMTNLNCLPVEPTSTHLSLASAGLSWASWTEGEGPSGCRTEWVGEFPQEEGQAVLKGSA